jgi:hypothetical protein
MLTRLETVNVKPVAASAVVIAMHHQSHIASSGASDTSEASSCTVADAKVTDTTDRCHGKLIATPGETQLQAGRTRVHHTCAAGASHVHVPCFSVSYT